MADNEEFKEVTAGEAFFWQDFESSPMAEEKHEWGLIYLGVGPGFFRIGLRDFMDDMIRASFGLDFTFDLNSRFFKVKGEAFEVQRADNEALVVRHLPVDEADD